MSWSCLFLLAAIPSLSSAQTAPVVVSTNTTIRIMASNLTSGNLSRYESPGLNILKALKPDVVAVQEFKYTSATQGENTANAFREMIDNTFGTNFVYFRESGKTIPNGIISRYPILSSGIWDDTIVPDREFVWARLDIPGTNDLYVVSVHLYTQSSTDRNTQANTIRTNIQAQFPPSAFIVVAGDFNADSRTESCMTTFKTFLSDTYQPVDQSGTNKNTNAGRTKPYDYVLPSFSLNSNHVVTVIGANSFPNGLVFDSRVYTPLSEVAPVISTDSAAFNMQHMGVVKDFRISHTVTNYITVTPPYFTSVSTNLLRWAGQSNITYSVNLSTNLLEWLPVGTASSTSNLISFSLTNNPSHRSFYRVSYP